MSKTKFITKDSGKRIKYKTGAKRDVSKDKPRFDLISPYALKRVADLMARGAEKYGEWNWSKGIPRERCYESMLRHAYQYSLGDISEDHLSAVIFNAMCIIHYQEIEKKNVHKQKT